MKFFNFPIIKKVYKFNKYFDCFYNFLNKITSHIPITRKVFNNKKKINFFFKETSSYFVKIKSLMMFLKFGNKCFYKIIKITVYILCVFNLLFK